MIYIIKLEGLYQNKVNSNLVSTCNRKMGYFTLSIEREVEKADKITSIWSSATPFCLKYFVPLLFKCVPLLNEFSFYCLLFFYIFEYRLRQVPTKVA